MAKTVTYVGPPDRLHIGPGGAIDLVPGAEYEMPDDFEDPNFEPRPKKKQNTDRGPAASQE